MERFLHTIPTSSVPYTCIGLSIYAEVVALEYNVRFVVYMLDAKDVTSKTKH